MADNVDRSKVKAAAQLSAATSHRSAGKRLEFAQTRKTRQSWDASKEINIDQFSINTPKRSQSPLPLSSVVEGAKKRKMAFARPLIDTSKSKSLDAKLPVAVAASKQLEAEEAPEKAKENPKKSPDPAGAKGNKVGVLSQSNGQAPAPNKEASSVADIEQPPFKLLESCARAMLGPSGDDIYFLDSLQHFYKRYNECNVKIAQRLFKLDTSNTKKHWENETLKDRLNTMTDRMKDLDESLSQQTKQNKELTEKYMGALKARTSSEKDFQSQMQMAKLLTDEQTAELKENQSQIDYLKIELNNIQETNRGMASVLSELQMKLKQSEETVTQLLDENKKLIAALQERKLEIQEMVDEKGVFKLQISQLEAALKERALDYHKLNQRIVEFQQLQLLADETAKQLELSQNEKNSMKTLLAEKETVQISLNERIKELEAAKISLIEINEVYAEKLDAVKAKSSIDLKAQKDAFDDTILKLNSTLNQQLLDLTKLSRSHEDLKAANLLQISLHNGELQQCAMQKIELEEINKSLESKLQVQTKSLEAQQSENQEKLNRATKRLKVCTSIFKGARKRYEADIAALKANIEEQDKSSKAEQEKMKSLMAVAGELEKSFFNLKDEKEQIANEFAAAKIQFQEELKCQADSLKNELLGLQVQLKTKEFELIGLEHEKNEQDKVSKAEQEKMQSLTAVTEELEERLSNLKDEKEQIANEFAAAKIQFDQQLNCQADSLFELQLQLKTKETELIGLEHEKNTIISQLKHKMNRIGSVFDQPITSTKMARPSEAKKSSKRSRGKGQHELNAAADSLPSSPKKRRSPRINVIDDVSDFESEDDDMPVKLSFSNRGKLAVVNPQGDDLFDALKNSTN